MTTISKIKVGSCNVKESLVIKGGRRGILEFPVHVYLIEHKELGLTLVDGGFDEAVFKKPLYKRVLGVQLSEKESLKNSLAALGYQFKDIQTIVMTHFHEDHIGNLPELRHATLYTHRCYQHRKEIRGFEKIHLVTCEEHFEDLGFYGENLATGIRLINLEGHAKGMLGLVFDDQKIILASDAGWRMDWLDKLNRYTFVAKLIQYRFKDYCQVLDKLQDLMAEGWSVDFNHDGDGLCL